MSRFSDIKQKTYLDIHFQLKVMRKNGASSNTQLQKINMAINKGIYDSLSDLQRIKYENHKYDIKIRKHTRKYSQKKEPMSKMNLIKSW